jgi:hypothetical protein
MQTESKIRALLVLLVILIAATPACRAAQPSAPQFSSAQVVREIVDPSSGARWMLLRDIDRPGGPGRLVLVSSTISVSRGSERKGDPAVLGPAPVPPMIHAGEEMTVEENSPVVASILQGVALGPAAIGSPFNVRLHIGGKVVRVVALAPGQAVLEPEGQR